MNKMLCEDYCGFLLIVRFIFTVELEESDIMLKIKARKAMRAGSRTDNVT